MRMDVREGVMIYMMNEIKPNYSAVAKQYGCDPRTVKNHLNVETKASKDRSTRVSKLDAYKTIINEKLDLNCSAMAIMKFIQKKGYTGGYTILKDYCRQIKKETLNKATIRIETNPGLSAQVDWKEDITLVSRNGEMFTFNIFCYVLGYSRMKYYEATLDRKQETVFDCLRNAFHYTQGIPSEIWFDNMRTVVDRSRTQYTKVQFNQKFYYFSKDFGFTPIACRPFRPQTKGKVESIARLLERLRVYNGEFDDFSDIYAIVLNFMDEVNHEESQATGCPPLDLWIKEKEYLQPLVSDNIINSYRFGHLSRKVSKESMVIVQKRKYSVPVRFIGKEILIKFESDELNFYYNGKLIQKHPVSNHQFNYNPQDAFDILRSDLMKQASDEEIERFIEENLTTYDY